MKELFNFLWTSAPELMSLLTIIGILIFITVKLTMFFAEFKNMGGRISGLEIRMTNLETRMIKLEEGLISLNSKVDRIIEYLLIERSKEK